MVTGARTPKLPWDWTGAWLVLLTAGAMGFVASLGLAAASGADALARSWTDELKSRATVSLILPVDEPARRDKMLARALQTIRAAPGVTDARPLSEVEMRALVEPWLGGDPGLADLPLPSLIDLTLAPGAPLDAKALAERLSEAEIDAEVDAHGRWVARLQPAAKRLRAFAYGAVMILFATAGLTVALACAAGLAARAGMVQVLKLVGATDGYVARIFVRRIQTLAFAGSALGAGLAAVALVLGSSPIAPDEAATLAPLLPSLTPPPSFWPLLAATPLVFGLIATAAGRVTVLLTLRRQAV